MAEPAGPEPRKPVEDLPTVRVAVVTALGFNQDSRIRLELAVSRVRHPVSVELALGQARSSVGVAQFHVWFSFFVRIPRSRRALP